MIGVLTLVAMAIGWALAETGLAVRGGRAALAALGPGDGRPAPVCSLSMSMSANPAVGGLGVAVGPLLGAGMDRAAAPGRAGTFVFDGAVAAITLHAVGATAAQELLIS